MTIHRDLKRFFHDNVIGSFLPLRVACHDLLVHARLVGMLGSMLGKVPISILAAVLLSACANVRNLHQVDAKIWRSAQPTHSHFHLLEKQGIGEVLTLRDWHPDDDLASRFKFHQITMRAGQIKDEEIVKALRIIVSAEKPVLIHCYHGSDRTGVVVAMYRMVVQNWSREKAIAELMEPELGHHARIFPGIRRYLQTVDIEKIREEVYAKPLARPAATLPGRPA